MASVMARKSRQDDVTHRVHQVFGLDLPASPRRVAVGRIAFAWAGPGHWLAMADEVESHAFEHELRRALPGLASVSNQSDGRTVIRIGGMKARDALAKGVTIDLHPRAFGPGHAAVTSVAHVGVHFWQLDPEPTYELVMFRSFGAAFWQWLVASSAEFGVEVQGG